ncbi:MAG: DUF2085 domain-containing protein [Verrucomicrobiota bacterium]
MSFTLSQLFYFACGQNAAHTWMPGGELLPVCQRCTGLYTGAAMALILHAWLRPRPTFAWCLVHSLLLLQMVPFGFHWVPQDAVVRTLTGYLFGGGLIGCLWLLPAQWKAGKSPETPARGRTVVYSVLASTVLGAVLWLVQAGPISAQILTGWIVLGFISLSVLSLLNLGALGIRIAKKIRAR